MNTRFNKMNLCEALQRVIRILPLSVAIL